MTYERDRLKVMFEAMAWEHAARLCPKALLPKELSS